MHQVANVDGGYKSYDIEKRILAEAQAELYFVPIGELAANLPGCAGLLVRQSIISRELMLSLPSLKVVARYGIGVDNVDCQAATEFGIVVANTPGYCNEEVSTHAVALLLAAARFLTAHHQAVLRGEWDMAARYEIHRLAGRVMGLLGFGGIARAAAPKFSGLGLEVIAHDPYLPPQVFEAAGVESVDFDTLLTNSDYISVHAPATPETHHLFNDDTFARMKTGAIIVNTSRGPLIDEQALVRAIRSGKLAAAALDVFEAEPLPADSPLRREERIVLSDHAAWYSEEALAAMQTLAAQAVRDVLTDRKPASVANPKVLAKLDLGA